jgi:hypothetical protein
MLMISGQYPSEGSKGVDLDSLIEFSIVNDGAGMDSSTLVVEVSGSTAISDLEFHKGFDGLYSDIQVSSELIDIVIDAEDLFRQGQVVSVKIQVENLEGKFFNYNYLFKTVTPEPVLGLSSPSADELVQSDQVVFLQFKDEIDDINVSSINVWINNLEAVIDGVFQDTFSGESSVITKIDDGATVRIEPVESFRNGPYTIRYYVEDTSGNILQDELSYSVDLPEIVLPSTFPQVRFLGFSQGIRKVSNMGRGDMFKIEWHQPVSRSYKGDSFALIYQNESRLEIFDSNPNYIAKSSTRAVELSGFTPGLTLSFAARALETFKDTLVLDGMVEAAEGLFAIPDDAVISGQITQDDNRIDVESTDGYPSSGILIINDSEVVRYVAKTDIEFLLAPNGRGLNGTSKGIYVQGDSIKMFLACQDTNSVIIMATPTYHDGYESGRVISGTGLVVTDYTDSDKKFFQGFDFCGYHKAIPQNIFQGVDDCGSYLGGEFNKTRGMNLFDRMLNREEVILDQTGEPVILLKRVWDGKTCSCSDSRRQHPKVKSCKLCFGTGYSGGYSQYDYKRRNDSRIMVMFGDTVEDLKLGPHSHLEQQYEPACWTLPSPAVRDRDLIVRFDFNNDVEYMYEVLDVTKDKLFYRHYTRQRLRLKRLDKTDVVYTYPYSLNT